MQDDNHIDKSFIDRAWTNMNTMLDQEMPVQEKKRRRFIFLWFLSPLLLLGGLTGYWHWANTPSTIPVSHFKIPVLKSNPKKQSKKVFPIAEVYLQDTDTSTPKRINQSSLVALKEGVNRYDSTTYVEKFIIPIAEDIENNKALVISKEAKILKDKQNIPWLNEIPCLNPELLELQDFVDIPPIAISSHNSTKPSIGLEVGGRSGNGLAFAGGYVGFFTEFNIGKRMGITTGMRMDLHSFSFDDRSFAFLSADEKMSENDTISVENNGNSADPIFSNEDIDYALTGHFLQFEWPLKISYDLDTKWKLMMGGYINFVVDAYEKVEGITESRNTMTGGVNLESYTNQRAISEKTINLWNGGLELGVVYKITPKWQLNLDVSYGLNSWLKEGNDGIRRSAQLGVRYQIN